MVVYAETTPTAVEAPAPRTQEIVVTAKRRQQTVEDVPYISASSIRSISTSRRDDD